MGNSQGTGGQLYYTTPAKLTEMVRFLEQRQRTIVSLSQRITEKQTLTEIKQSPHNQLIISAHKPQHKTKIEKWEDKVTECFSQTPNSPKTDLRSMEGEESKNHTAELF